jgi:LacI family transcriptional regulator
MNNPKSKPRSVSIKDIARAAGLSFGAVSLALRNLPGVSKATCMRVQALARKMGYEPNPMAVGLAHHKQTSKVQPVHAALAWLNLWPGPGKLHSYKYFDGIWRGASRSAEKFGFHLDEFAVNDKMTLPRIEKVLLARGVTGILLPSVGAASVNWSDIDWSHFSAVRFSLTVKINMHAAIADGMSNGMLAFAKMREKGYKRIAWAGDPKYRECFHGGGFLWAEQEVPPQDRLPPFFTSGADCIFPQGSLAAWLKKTKPDAIFTDRPEFLEVLKKIGCRVPEDVGLVTNNVLDCSISAGIDPNPEEIGRAGVLALVSLIHDNDCGLPLVPRQITIPGRWVDGVSLPQR